MTDHSEFLRNYSPSSWPEIYCSCSNSEGKIEIDPKAEFRSQLIEHVLSKPQSASPQLLRDLFSFEAEHSEHSQSTHSQLDDLASMMLEQSNGSFVMDFLEGLERTFDTQMALASLSISDETRQAALIRLLEIKRASNSEGNELLEYGLNYFSDKRAK
jgi:hypothetical protein